MTECGARIVKKKKDTTTMHTLETTSTKQGKATKPVWSFNCPSAAPYIPDMGQTGFYNVINFRAAKTSPLGVTAAEKVNT